MVTESLELIQNDKEREAEALIEGFMNMALCHSCWLKSMEYLDKKELGKRLLRWWCGDYVNNTDAGKRLEKAFAKVEENVKNNFNLKSESILISEIEGILIQQYQGDSKHGQKIVKDIQQLINSRRGRG